MWPGCKRSKTPFVNTTAPPRPLTSAANCAASSLVTAKVKRIEALGDLSGVIEEIGGSQWTSAAFKHDHGTCSILKQRTSHWGMEMSALEFGAGRAVTEDRLAEMLEARATEMAEALTLDGTSKAQAEKEVTATIGRIVHYAGWADKYEQVLGCVNPVASPHFNFTLTEPVGIVGVLATTAGLLFEYYTGARKPSH